MTTVRIVAPINAWPIVTVDGQTMPNVSGIELEMGRGREGHLVSRNANVAGRDSLPSRIRHPPRRFGHPSPHAHPRRGEMTMADKTPIEGLLTTPEFVRWLELAGLVRRRPVPATGVPTRGLMQLIESQWTSGERRRRLSAMRTEYRRKTRGRR